MGSRREKREAVEEGVGFPGVSFSTKVAQVAARPTSWL